MTESTVLLGLDWKKIPDIWYLVLHSVGAFSTSAGAQLEHLRTAGIGQNRWKNICPMIYELVSTTGKIWEKTDGKIYVP
jgi:hypothetical protein